MSALFTFSFFWVFVQKSRQFCWVTENIYYYLFWKQSLTNFLGIWLFSTFFVWSSILLSNWKLLRIFVIVCYENKVWRIFSVSIRIVWRTFVYIFEVSLKKSPFNLTKNLLNFILCYENKVWRIFVCFDEKIDTVYHLTHLMILRNSRCCQSSFTKLTKRRKEWRTKVKWWWGAEW